MSVRPIFRAALIHTSGSDVGLREEVDLPMVTIRPPESLRRPVNLGGIPSYEEWGLASLDEWHADPPVAMYKFVGHTRRDPRQPPDASSGRILPWRR